MGEGSGCFILESEEKAKKRNANIIAYLYTRFSSDTSSPTSQQALRRSKMQN